MLKKRNDEDFHTYACRLYDNKKEYGLNSQIIADLLNIQSGENKTESAWRKFYKAFRAGINYKSKNEVEVVNDKSTRILSISDLHIPYQKSIQTFVEYRNKIDILQINGDVLDMQGISSFPKMYRHSPVLEMMEAKSYLVALIKYLNPKKVICNIGNHEYRLAAYVAKNFDTDLNCLLPKTPLELIFEDGFYYYDKKSPKKDYFSSIKSDIPEIEVQFVNDWYCQIGNVIFAHPLAFSSAMMKTAEKAMLWFRNEGKTFSGLVLGHTHRIGMYAIGNTIVYEQGCCCETKSNNYTDGKLVNSQKEGFLYLEIDNNGDIIHDKTKQIIIK